MRNLLKTGFAALAISFSLSACDPAAKKPDVDTTVKADSTVKVDSTLKDTTKVDTVKK